MVIIATLRSSYCLSAWQCFVSANSPIIASFRCDVSNKVWFTSIIVPWLKPVDWILGKDCLRYVHCARFGKGEWRNRTPDF